TGSGTGFQLRDLTAGSNSPTFAGTQAITWALNNSGRTLSYPAPDGTAEPIANDRMDVWVGRSKVFNDIAVITPDGALTDLKWYWSSGSGITTFSNFQVGPFPKGGGATVAGYPELGAAASAPSEQAPPAAGGSLELYRPTPNPFERSMRFAYS